MERLLITLGDPAGIGPYLVVKSLLNIDLKAREVVLIGDGKFLSRIDGFSEIENRVKFLDLANAGNIQPGKPSPESGRAALDYIEKAVELIKSGTDYALVTCPVSKEFIKLNREDFLGHTEFLASEFSVKRFAMMMVGKKFRIVFLTRHIPVRQVLDNLKPSEIEGTLLLSIDALRNMFGIKTPRISLCSCNPHAGVNTYLEKEELILTDVIRRLSRKKTGAHFFGPYASDTLFKYYLDTGYDLAVVFYHDQGMIPFKTLDFDSGVNLTLGLPFVRTSPAHGPAFNLVNSENLIDYRSMKAALNLACSLQI